MRKIFENLYLCLVKLVAACKVLIYRYCVCKEATIFGQLKGVRIPTVLGMVVYEGLQNYKNHSHACNDYNINNTYVFMKRTKRLLGAVQRIVKKNNIQ